MYSYSFLPLLCFLYSGMIPTARSLFFLRPFLFVCCLSHFFFSYAPNPLSFVSFFLPCAPSPSPSSLSPSLLPLFCRFYTSSLSFFSLSFSFFPFLLPLPHPLYPSLFALSSVLFFLVFFQSDFFFSSHSFLCVVPLLLLFPPPPPSSSLSLSLPKSIVVPDA